MPRIRTWINRIVQYPQRFTITNNGDGTSNLAPSPGTIAQAGTTINAAMLNAVEADLQLSDDIVSTTQTPTFNSLGQIIQMVHTDSGNNVIRTDTFTYTAALIKEVRTLQTGETKTLKSYFNTDGSYNRTEVS